MKLTYFLLLAVLLLVFAPPTVSAQEPTGICGIVDALDYPIDGLVPGYDDFSLYRTRFGGNHTGLDIGFDRWGDPVFAAARGRVTYSDPAGWGTEKGVVIIEHDFPDGSIAYGVYGHMEESETIRFPSVGSCVERGTLIGTIGWPSRGRPHLHYELRNFLPFDGGPGYVNNNPLDDGWYNPLDFTALWRVRLTPAYVSSITFDQPTTLPPMVLDSGLYVTASNDLVSASLPPNQVLWRIKADSTITGMAGLSGDRIVIRTQSGQVNVLQAGRYLAVWSINGADMPFVTLGEKIVFVTTDAGLAAYDTAGTLLWQVVGAPGDTPLYFGLNGEQIALAVQKADSFIWQMLNRDGQITAEIPLSAPPIAYPLSDGSWLVIEDQNVIRLQNGQSQTVGTLAFAAGRGGQITTDSLGNIYLYLDDSAHTLFSLDGIGNTRWQITYPGDSEGDWPPLLQTGSGCLLYTLDAGGMLRVFSGTDGTPINQIQLYAGGRRNTSPGARVLRVDASEQVVVAAGFITMLTLDGLKLGGSTAGGCP